MTSFLAVFQYFSMTSFFIASSVLIITSLIFCSMTSYVSHSLTLFIHSPFLGFCHNVIVWMILAFVRLFKAMLASHIFHAWLVAACGLEAGGSCLYCLILELFFFLIVSTSNMYRPLFCVCYIDDPPAFLPWDRSDCCCYCWLQVRDSLGVVAIHPVLKVSHI